MVTLSYCIWKLIKKGSVLLCIFSFYLGIVGISYASGVQFELTVDRNTVSLGESLQLNLTFHDTQSMPAPDVGNLDGFKVRYIGPSTSVSIINGKVSTSITHIYTLIPLKTGTFKVGPFSIDFKGTTLTSNSITVEVLSSATHSGQTQQRFGVTKKTVSKEELKDRIFLVIEAKKPELYINEPIPLSIKLYINQLGVRDIQYPRLEHEGFSVKKYGKPKQYKKTLGGILYDVIEFDTEVFALKPGLLTLGPAEIDCNLVVRKKTRHRSMLFDDEFFSGFFDDNIFDDFFGRYEVYPFTVKSAPLTIDVLELPSTNRPVDFKGAVGDFKLNVGVTPRELKVGDPITVTMTIEGTGNFDTVTSPLFESTKGFKVYQPQERQKDNKKVFEQVLIPESETLNQIPRVKFSFFNPQSRTYHTLVKGPFSITVTKPRKPQEAKIVEIPGVVVEARKETLGRDIVYIKESPGRLRPLRKHLYQNLFFWLYHFIVTMIFFILVGVYGHKERLRSDMQYARRLYAPTKAKKGLDEARRLLRQGKDREFFDIIYKTLVNYLSDRFHIPPGSVDTEFLKDAFGSRDLDKKILGKILDIFNACDMVRYAPIESGRYKKAELFNNTRQIVDYLERKKI